MLGGSFCSTSPGRGEDGLSGYLIFRGMVAVIESSYIFRPKVASNATFGLVRDANLEEHIIRPAP